MAMKKTLVAFCAGFLALASTADVLLWQVTTEEAGKYKAEGDAAADYAVFYYANAEGDGVEILDRAALFQGDYAAGNVAAMKEQNALEFLPAGTDLSGKSFWIELYYTDKNWTATDSNKVAWSMPIAYETLQQYMTGTLTALPPVYHPTVVPEPTGGLLVLLGLAGLALRRRR